MGDFRGLPSTDEMVPGTEVAFTNITSSYLNNYMYIYFLSIVVDASLVIVFVCVVVVVVSSSRKEHPLQVPHLEFTLPKNIFFFIEMRMVGKNVVSLMIYLFVIFIGNGNITIFRNVFRLLISVCLIKIDLVIFI